MQLHRGSGEKRIWTLQVSGDRAVAFEFGAIATILMSERYGRRSVAFSATGVF